MKVYKFRKYEKTYPVLYNNEKERIKGVLSKKCLIEHIGSTAVCKLPGKGIIDIMVSCPKSEMNKIKIRLIKKGYILKTSSDKGRIFLRRETRLKGKERRFHLHITSLNHSLWKSAINFRNYLIKHPKISNEYANLKKEAAINCNNDGEIYRKLKNKFIENCIKKAKKQNQRKNQ